MRLTVPALLLLAAATPASAQPMLTSATSSPTLGMYYQVFENTQFLPGPSGAGQTWDFTAQTFTSGAAVSYEACNAVNKCSSIAPGTTIVLNSLRTISAYTHHVGTASTLSVAGGLAGSGTYIYTTVYTNPDEVFHFPFSYGNSYADNYSLSISEPNLVSYQTGTDSVSADAWGSLKTPAGTFSNTLRIKRIKTYVDSSNTAGVPKVAHARYITYDWMDAAHRASLLTVSTFTYTPATGAPTTSNASRYTGTQTLDVPSASTNDFSWQLSPNPATNRIQVSINLAMAANVSLSLIDITGRLVRGTTVTALAAGSNKLSINVEGLSPGLYTVKLSSGPIVLSSKVAIQ